MTNDEIMEEVLREQYLATGDNYHTSVSYDGKTYYLNMAGAMLLNIRLSQREWFK